MKFLFPSQPGDASIPDVSFEKELLIANELADCYLVDVVDLFSESYKNSIRRILNQEKLELFLYRGWMLSYMQYKGFEFALKEKNALLINNASVYVSVHYMNRYFDLIKNVSPASVFIENWLNIGDMWEKCCGIFPNADSLFIKDSVSSQKYLWKETSFIKDFKKNRDQFELIVSNFLKSQKEYRGTVQDFLVFREYIPLRNIGQHKLGMPYSQEFRSFVFRGEIISTHKYWEKGKYFKDTPPKKWLNEIVAKIYEQTKNNFFTIDTAQTEKLDWIVIELGDGQVSSIQDDAEVKKIYKKLINKI